MTKRPKAKQDVFDEEAFWAYVDGEFVQIEATFTDYPLETRRQALTGLLRKGRDHKKGTSPLRSSKGDFIRYRDVDPDYSSRDYFFVRGKALVPALEKQIARREITLHFIRDFAEAKTCYGFIISHILDDSDTLAPTRASTKSADSRADAANAKRQFVARLLKKRHDAGTSAKEAVIQVAKEISEIIAAGSFEPAYPKNWFEKLLAKMGTTTTLASSFRENNLTKVEVKKLASLPADHLPKVGAPKERAGK